MKGAIPKIRNCTHYPIYADPLQKEAGCALNLSTKPESNNSTTGKEAKKHPEVHVSDVLDNPFQKDHIQASSLPALWKFGKEVRAADLAQEG